MTFSRILLALDGSPLSEQALVLAACLGGADAEYSLLRVVTDEGESGQESARLAAARDYLRALADERFGGAASQLVVEGDDPAEQILGATAGHDLLVLMTHGRRGVRRWAMGSVAERVIRHCSIPLLLGNPESIDSMPQRFTRILVPLDGSERAAAAIAQAAAVARELRAELVLFRAAWVDPTDNAMAYAREEDALRASGEAALERRAAPLRESGLAVSTRFAFDYPAEAILGAVERTGADLIAMTTHGRTGVKRWLLGSVAEKVLRTSPCPVLLTRVDD